SWRSPSARGTTSPRRGRSSVSRASSPAIAGASAPRATGRRSTPAPPRASFSARPITARSATSHSPSSPRTPPTSDSAERAEEIEERPVGLLRLLLLNEVSRPLDPPNVDEAGGALAHLLEASGGDDGAHRIALP